MEEKEVKHFYCGSKDECFYKQHYVNKRCFAPYVIRQSCRYILRADNKTVAEGSKEGNVLYK